MKMKFLETNNPLRGVRMLLMLMLIKVNPRRSKGKGMRLYL